MIKYNSYKINNKNSLLFIIASTVAILLIISTIDIKKIILKEIDGFQSRFVTFSSYIQLFDSGDIQELEKIQFKDYIPAARQLLSVFYDGIISEKNQNLPEINFFIKFSNLNKIYNDIEKANLIGNNYKPSNVPCKVSDGVNVFNCKIKLKGELEDHWSSKNRFSLKVTLSNGFIYGLKEFSIHKPISRQFPYDQAFAYINTKLGGLSIHDQRFYNIKVNSDNWGVMNIEPVVNDFFIELNQLKRSGVFRISNQDNRIYYKNNRILLNNHFISDPTLYLSQKGKKNKIFRDLNNREIYSNIFHFINSKNPKLFDRDKMIDSFILSMVWGYLHPLTNANSFYTWNTYTKKLEPILTDQSYWRNIDEEIKNIKVLPYEYGLIFREEPLTKSEYYKSLNKIILFFEDNDLLEIVNNLQNKYFKNDRQKINTPVYNNLKFLQDNHVQVLNWVNNLAIESSVNKKSEIYEFPVENYPNEEFLKFIHFTDGKVKIFNLMSNPIFISHLVFENKKININKKIPGSYKKNLSFFEINTNIYGIQDKKILLNAKFQNTKKDFFNDYTLINKSYFNKKNILNKNDICNSKSDQDICYVSGIHTIVKSVIFTKKIIIQKGAKIILKNNSDLIFENSVEMNGSINEPILFLGKGSVTILNNHKSYNKSVINFVEFSNLTSPSLPLNKLSGSVNIYGGNNIISNSAFSNGSSEDQLNIVHSNVLISDVKFINSKSDSFDCDFCTGEISNINFLKSGGDALDISGSNLKIRNIVVNYAKDKAISVGENSNVDIFNVKIENSSTGLAVKDGSKVNIKNITLNKIIHDAFMTYVKKPFYTNYTKLNVMELLHVDQIEGNLCVRQTNTLARIENKLCNEINIDINNLYKQGRMKK